MKQIIIIALLLISVFGQWIHARKTAEFPDILKAESILVDGELLIVTQESMVSLYSLKDFRHIADFARRGEGPGEVKSSAIVHILHDSLFAFSRPLN